MTKYMENQQKQNITLNDWEYHFVKVKVIEETNCEENQINTSKNWVHLIDDLSFNERNK